MAPPAVRLSGVTRVFGAAPALIRADLSVERGEVLLVRGPNGAGKSTLLRVIATALSPTYGSGSVLGFDLVTGREEIRRRVELLAHRTRLYEDLTARENLRFTSALYGLDAGRIDPVLRDVGLADAAGERVRGYSHGMRQRVAVARALLGSGPDPAPADGARPAVAGGALRLDPRVSSGLPGRGRGRSDGGPAAGADRQGGRVPRQGRGRDPRAARDGGRNRHDRHRHV